MIPESIPEKRPKTVEESELPIFWNRNSPDTKRAAKVPCIPRVTIPQFLLPSEFGCGVPPRSFVVRSFRASFHSRKCASRNNVARYFTAAAVISEGGRARRGLFYSRGRARHDSNVKVIHWLLVWLLLWDIISKAQDMNST